MQIFGFDAEIWVKLCFICQITDSCCLYGKKMQENQFCQGRKSKGYDDRILDVRIDFFCHCFAVDADLVNGKGTGVSGGICYSIVKLKVLRCEERSV